MRQVRPIPRLFKREGDSGRNLVVSQRTGHTLAGSMIKALQLLFGPAKTWDAISRQERGVPAVIFVHLLPAIAIACALEGWALVTFGNQPIKLDFASRQVVEVTRETAIRFAVGQAVISVATVFLLGFFLQLLLRSFHRRAPFRLAFSVMAHCYGLVLLMQIVDGIPAAPTWLCRFAGAVLAARAFYIGLIRVIRPDPSTALGLYFLGALLLFAFAGISHFVALQILEGNLLQRFPWQAASG